MKFMAERDALLIIFQRALCEVEDCANYCCLSIEPDTYSVELAKETIELAAASIKSLQGFINIFGIDKRG